MTDILTDVDALCPMPTVEPYAQLLTLKNSPKILFLPDFNDFQICFYNIRHQSQFLYIFLNNAGTMSSKSLA